MKEEARKTKDVEITEDVSFRDMMLSEHLIAGLTKCNFKKPSPIQLRAIPIGRCGLDLIIQSKSGTGKTLVFCTIIFERYDPEIRTPQSLIVVPTREIALQVECYLNSIGSTCKGFNVASVIGGRDIVDDRKRISKCKAIVGTPGRIIHLIKNNYVCMKNIQTFVLDEADKLVTDDFYSDINVVLNALNKDRQIIASSATYANGLDKLIVSFMHNPIAISTSRDSPVLIGIKQFILPVERFPIPNSVQNSTPSIQAMWRKVSAVEYILTTTSFKQCILFSNSQFRANSFANYLTQNKWNVELVLGSHDQETRTRTLQRFRQYKSRILVTSDLMARGVDIVNINLVINLDVPSDSSTYLHRIGRCGRFGRRGLAITLSSDETELKKFRKMLEAIGGNKIKIPTFPVNLNGDTSFDVWNAKDDPDSHIFDSIDDKELEENGPKLVNEEKSHKSNVEKPNLDDGSEKDSVEQTNLNLLEVAKLLIDSPAPTQPTLDVDEDLFSDFQSSSITNATPTGMRPDVIISTDIFEDFAKSQSKAASGNESNEENANENKEIDLEEVNFVEATGKEHNHDSKNEPKPEEVNENAEDGNESQEDAKFSSDESVLQSPKKTNDKSRTGATARTLQMKGTQPIPKSFKHARAGPNHTSHSTKHNNRMHAPGLELPHANAFWIRTFWQQISDINHYVQSSHYQNKRKFL